MGLPKPPPGAKLICGILAADQDRLDRAVGELARRLGPIECRSEAWPFAATDYYADEMGENLLRQFVSFAGCVVPEQLVTIKLATNEIELHLCEAYGRPAERLPVNLDPGYVTLGKLVLATTKDHAHRIYLGEGIYGEITLRYWQHKWQPWPWTYPDYAAGTYFPFFLVVRNRLKSELILLARDESPSRP